MDRREFLKLSSACGLAACLPFAAERRLWADISGVRRPEGLYEGQLVVVVFGPGGWDQTMFCDPHPDLCNYYNEGDIETAGAIRYAPVPAVRDFFTKYGSMTTVFNGVDTLTNNHSVGPRANSSGRVSEGFPNIAAMLATQQGSTLPLPFLAHGAGYHGTAGLVSRTRSRPGGHLTKLMEPHRVYPGYEDEATFLEPSMLTAVQEAKQVRLAALRDEQQLPRIGKNIDALYMGNASMGDLVRLQDYLPEVLEEDDTRKAIQFMMASFAAGLSVSSSLSCSTNAFDSHDSNDPAQVATFAELLGNVDYLWEEAARQNVADRMTVLLCSDFGRTPNYNDRDNGKDHWQVGTVLVTGPNLQGNRVVGATDDGLMPVPVDPQTLEPSEDGIVLEPRHIQQALRGFLDIGSDLDEAFPLRAEPMPQGLLLTS